MEVPSWNMLKIINSLRPSDIHVYICQDNMPTWMLQIMACCLFGAKPLSEPMPPYCQLDIYFSEILCQIKKFSFKENTLESVVCQSGGHLVSASMCLNYTTNKYIWTQLWCTSDCFQMKSLTRHISSTTTLELWCLRISSYFTWAIINP